MRKLTRLQIAAIIVVVAGIGLVMAGRRMNVRKVGGQQPVEPFRIAGNLYYVGANDVSAFLITGSEGHVVIDAGYPTTAAMIMGSIATLGFDIRDVKVLLNSEPHPDHAGGLGVLQQASGAEIWLSEANAEAVAAGGEEAELFWPLKVLMRLDLVGYPPPRIDRRFKDGEALRVGPIAITPYVTPGHTRGCTSYAFTVHDAGRDLDVVSVCSLGRLATIKYDEQIADLERSIARLRGVPADLWVTSHARAWGRYRKFSESRAARNSIDPFIDPAGYRAYLDAAETELRKGVVH